MLFGYARVSTGQSGPGLRRNTLALAGCERVSERTGPMASLFKLQTGNAVVISCLDRLERSLETIAT